MASETWMGAELFFGIQEHLLSRFLLILLVVFDILAHNESEADACSEICSFLRCFHGVFHFYSLGQAAYYNQLFVGALY